VQQAIKRVNKLCEEKRLGAATAALVEVERLRQGGAARVQLSDEDAAEIIRQLNPPATVRDVLTEDLLRLVDETTPLVLTGAQVKDAVLHLTKGSAAGWTGWTFHSIFQLVGSESTGMAVYELIAQFFNRLLRGEGCDKLWTVVRAVLIPKKDSGWRPLGIGESWMRVMGRCVVKVVSAELGIKLQPLQFCIGVAGGCEIAGRLPQLAMASFEGQVGIITDQKNAFGLAGRAKMLEGILKYVPSLARFFVFGHSGGAELVLNGKIVGHNATGTCQGGLAVLFYPCGFHDILIQVDACIRNRIAELPTHEREAAVGFDLLCAGSCSG